MPRITASSLEEHREKSLLRIYAALGDLLSARGYDAVTLADVAAGSGIGRTSMYHYFSDKETLLLAYAGHATEEYLERLRGALANADNPIDELRVFVRMQLTQLAAQHLSFGALRTVLSEEGSRKMAEHVAPLAVVLRDILERAVAQRYLPGDDIEFAAPLVSAVISGRSAVDLDERQLDRVVDATITFVLRGLGARIGFDGRARRLPRARS